MIPMIPNHDPWDRLSGMARKAHYPETSAPPSIPWLPDLESRLHGLFLRLLWRRGALAAALIAAVILLTAYLVCGLAAPPLIPSIPLPPAP